VVCGLYGLVDDLADVVAGGERAHGATLGYEAGEGQGEGMRGPDNKKTAGQGRMRVLSFVGLVRPESHITTKKKSLHRYHQKYQHFVLMLAGRYRTSSGS
jgi:hypothetical protein